MEFLQSILESSNIPVVTAFVLGILTAISPCPLATNITAIGYIGKEIENKHRVFINGLLYTVGRILTYTILGFILIPILREGSSMFFIQKVISKYGEMLLAPALISIGLFMLFSHKINLSKFGFNGSGGDKLKNRGGLGALLLGILFSLSFCPTSGVFYFGMLLPMSAGENSGLLLPAVFAIATGLPVMIVAWILAYSITGIGSFYGYIQKIQKWSSRVVAILFIAVGIYYLILFY